MNGCYAYKGIKGRYNDPATTPYRDCDGDQKKKTQQNQHRSALSHTTLTAHDARATNYCATAATAATAANQILLATSLPPTHAHENAFAYG